MIPKTRTADEEKEMEQLMEVISTRTWTHEEAKAYFRLLGHDEAWAEQLAREGFPRE